MHTWCVLLATCSLERLQACWMANCLLMRNYVRSGRRKFAGKILVNDKSFPIVLCSKNFISSHYAREKSGSWCSVRSVWGVSAQPEIPLPPANPQQRNCVKIEKLEILLLRASQKTRESQTVMSLPFWCAQKGRLNRSSHKQVTMHNEPVDTFHW